MSRRVWQTKCGRPLCRERINTAEINAACNAALYRRGLTASTWAAQIKASCEAAKHERK